MKYISYAACFLLLLIDILAFIFLFLYPVHLKGVLIVHTIVAILAIILIKNTMDIFKGVPVYLILFMPGLGGIIVFGLFFSLSYFMKDSIVLSDYEALIEFNNTLDFKEKINYDKEIRTMSFLDMLDVLGSYEKKQLIIDSEIFEYNGKVKLLQKGLSDKDTEVQHYSATLLNDKENEFTNRINYLREEYNLEKNNLILETLSNTYKKYITSDLIGGEVLYIFNREYIETLQMLLKIKEDNLDFLNDLVRAYIRSNDFEMADKTNTYLLEKHPNSPEGLLNRLHISYEKDPLTKFTHLIKSLTEEEINSSKKIESLVSFWLKKGVET
ncbi:hypothetical protein [Clostridium sp. DL1XJH146]